uniref:ferritin light chain-like n=1 Tax=Jaculus jaculus TaxID=51337 RepID=UPI001E1B359B|nr:ferritin light chain-like [Jaculus jaculus]
MRQSKQNDYTSLAAGNMLCNSVQHCACTQRYSNLLKLFHQGGCCHQLVNLHLWTSYSFLSLGYYFNQDNVALQVVDLFFCELAEKCKDTKPVIKMQLSTLTGCAEAFKAQWEKTQKAMKDRLLPEPSLLNFHALYSTFTDLNLCDFLDEEVKYIQKMVNNLNNLQGLVDSHPSLGKHLFEWLTLKHGMARKPHSLPGAH